MVDLGLVGLRMLVVSLFVMPVWWLAVIVWIIGYSLVGVYWYCLLL